jgi:hypothetical protein
MGCLAQKNSFPSIWVIFKGISLYSSANELSLDKKYPNFITYD